MKKTIFFLLPIFIILLIAQLYYCDTYGSKVNDYGKLIINESVAKKEIVVLGDSHTSCSFSDDRDTTKILNLSYPSDSIKEMYLKLSAVLNHENNIRIVIIPIDYHVLSSYRLGINNMDLIYPYIDLKEFNQTYSTDRNQLDKFLIKKMPILLFRERSKTLEFFLKNRSSKLNSAEGKWGILSPEEKKSISNSRANRMLGGNLIEEELHDYYKKILGLCNNNNIEMLGVRFPVTSEYLTSANEYDLQPVDEFLNKVEMENKNFHLVDYSSLYINSDDLFINSDHLNSKGAKLFMEMFGDVIVDRYGIKIYDY